MTPKPAANIDIDSELGEKLKEIKLKYFSTLAEVAISDMTQAQIDELNRQAVTLAYQMINSCNSIEKGRERIAVMSMAVFNAATSLYLTVDAAILAVGIEEEFGETNRD